ncbi:MAG: GNAT family N-acetyltransferase, partial [Synergistaceae bacterium]|nr:GNAT family N-acetyltransferase [Synergistaceae bacterium]
QTRPDRTSCLNFQVKLFGKNLIRFYDHYICRLEWGKMKPVVRNRLTPFEIMPGNLSLIDGSKALHDMLSRQPEYTSGWGFRDEDGNIVAREFMMRKGGDERLYKIRNVYAYLFAVEVFEPYRGREYAGEMISWLARKIHDEEGVNELYLAVMKDNTSALKAYGKLGFEVVGSRFFARVLKLNIPYHTL